MSQIDTNKMDDSDYIFDKDNRNSSSNTFESTNHPTETETGSKKCKRQLGPDMKLLETTTKNKTQT